MSFIEQSSFSNSGPMVAYSSPNSDFDCPQMGWRGTRHIEKLYECMAAYGKMTPKLPMPLIAGDIYDEGKENPHYTQDALTKKGLGPKHFPYLPKY